MGECREADIQLFKLELDSSMYIVYVLGDQNNPVIYNATTLEKIPFNTQLNYSFQPIEGAIHATKSPSGDWISGPTMGIPFVYMDYKQPILVFYDSYTGKYLSKTKQFHPDEIQQDKLVKIVIPLSFSQDRLISVEPKPDNDDLKLQVTHLKQMVREQQRLLEALIRRVYNFQSLPLPETLDYNGHVYKQIAYDDYESIKSQIKSVEIPPWFQPYGGSHRSDHRICMIEDKSGNKYFCRVLYKDKKIQRPENP